MNKYQLTISFLSEHDFGDQKPPKFTNQQDLKNWLAELLEWFDNYPQYYEMKSIGLEKIKDTPCV